MTRRGSLRVGLVAIAVVAVLFPVVWPGAGAVPATPRATGGAASIALSLGADGALSVALSATDPNGSALRAAMDGNFTRLVDALPVNASQRTSVLTQITAAENTPILSSFFGDRNGQVEPGEVTLFQGLVRQEARLVPGSVLTGANLLNLTLDGSPARSVQLTGLGFDGAVGPVSSAAPVLVNSSFAYQFGYGSGEQSLAFGFRVALPVPQLPGLGPTVSVKFTSPAQTSITTTSGLDAVNVRNDPFGWGSSSVDAQYSPLANTPGTIHFRPAFPLGDVTLGATVAGAVAVAAFVLLRRRRLGRAATQPSEPEPPASP